MEAILSDINTPELACHINDMQAQDIEFYRMDNEIRALTLQPAGQSMDYYLGVYIAYAHSMLIVSRLDVPAEVRHAISYKCVGAAHKICQMLDSRAPK